MEHARPPPELQIEESPVVRAAAWQKWWKQFSVFLKASGVNKEEKGVQASLLVNLIGPEGYEVFSNFTFVKEDDAEDIECLKKKFDEHFGTKSNITAVRFKFFTRNQHPGETISQYVTALKTLSKNCEFEHLRDGLIRDRIVCGVSNTVVRDRMLRTTTLTLEKAVEICEAEELSRQESKKIEEVTTNIQVDAVAGPSGYGRGRGTFRGRGRGRLVRSRARGSGGAAGVVGGQRLALPRQRGPREPCGRCGSFYCDNGQRCPAVSATCFVCDRRGHFAKMCPHKSASKQVYNLNVTSDKSEDDDYDAEDSSLFISALKRDFTSSSAKEWIVNMDINGKSISFKLDSGAPLNVMSKITYESLGYDVSMLATFKTNVFSYTGNKLPIIGECYLPIVHKRVIYKLKFAITEMCVQNLIGLEDCVKLGFIQRIGALNMNNYADLFRGIGKLPGIHKIIINNSVQPVVCPARKVPLGLRDKLLAELQRMETLGVVRKVNHPTDWVNPIVIVSKKNGDIRVCLDPRILNRAIRRAHFSLPTVSEIASRLRGARFYSVLDARCGFWMLELDAASADLCTFSTPFGRYQFLRLPYGINCAPEMFHAKVRQHIEDLEGTDSFSDDIIVWGSSRKEHDERLERLLQRAKEIGLRFNKEKCKFGVNEITYLGHVFNEEGMKPDNNKIKAILEMPNPEDRKSLERFLGMVNYLSKFIPNYSESVTVLRSLLKKNIDWVWDEQHSIAIKQLKNKLSLAPVLALYSNTLPIVISVDASSSALGAVLMQDGRPVEFASLTLTVTQCRYAQIEKEMLAIVFSCERFHQYIFGRNDVTIQSDHKPLESIFKKPLISVPARLQRMMLRIQSYDIHVVYTPGKYMYIADTLSRAALPQLMNERITKDVDAQMCAVIAQVQFSDSKLNLVRQHTEKDNECLMLKDYIMKGWPRSRYEVNELIRKYWSYRECLQFIDGIILKNNCVFIPKTLRGEMLIRVHEGHLGIDRCKRRARDIMFWPGMSRDIEERVRGCEACAQLAPRQQREPLRPHDIPDVPWSKLGSDIFELHKKYYLVLVDYFSNFVEVNELKSINSKSVIKAMKEQFSRHGIPHELITDNGPAYRSLEFDNFMREWDIVHITSSPLYAQSNGKSERTIRTIKELFKKCLQSGQDPYLSLLNFRATPRNGLDSPAQMLMGRRLNTRLPIHKQMLKETVNNAKNYNRIISQQKLTKGVYDRSAKPLPPLKTGAKVVVADGQKREFMEVLDKCVEPRSYVLRDIIGRRYRRNRRHIIERQPEAKGENAAATSSGSSGVAAAGDVMISCAPSTSASAVNSPPVPHRDAAAPTTYRPYTEEYASVQRRVDRPLPAEPEPDRKKEKKWSIGKLFRRKKKDEDTSSSESDEATKSPSKRKSKKKKKTPAVNNFDHIVIRDTRRAQSLAKPSIRDVTDDGVLSDPSAGFIHYRAKTHELYGASKESLSYKEDSASKGKTALDTSSRRTRKGRLKARVEALRNSMKGESSSDEDSLKSSNSSSMIRFRSDDSLMRSRDSSLNKRSRSARNERYIKRLSRDEENQLNKEAELLQQGYTKAEVEMLTRTPTSQSSGYGTCKRDQTNNVKQEQLYANDAVRRPMKSESISSFPSTQSYPSSINFNAKVNNDHINYSIQYPSNNIKSHDKETPYANNNRERSVSHHYESPEKIMCVKFPLGNVTNVKREEKAPPVPPPRDIHRKVVTPLSMYYENNALIADRSSNNQKVLHGVPNNDFERVMRRSQERSLQGFNGLRRPISNSEDHIAMQNNEYVQNIQYRPEQPRRPASVSAEPNHYALYANSPPWRKSTIHNNIVKPEPVQPKNDYMYYADQSPRSRRPISIKTSQNGLDQNQYLSDSQASLNVADSVYRRPRNASDFWRKIDDAERQKRNQNLYANSRNSADFTNNCQLPKNSSYIEQNKPNPDHNDYLNKNRPKFKSASIDTTDDAKIWKATTEYKRSVTVEPPKTVTSPTSKTHVRHKSDTATYQMPSDDEKGSERRKSTNLDDALNELEAIYNSLGLGDEDLLDRAERRELMTPKLDDHFNDWNGNDDEVHLRSQPSTPLRRIHRRSTLPDKLQDDMAFRRMNSLTKDKSNYKDNQSQISYMLASPVYVPYASDDDRNSERNEPDVIYDDVVYRNIKQMNNRLKTLDPQPPFGIPIGPVSPAPQSDYLHAVPDNKGRPRFIPRRSPDLVSDDLAFRSLRKDNRHSAHFNGEEYSGHINNNHSYSEYPLNKESAASLKKKRAVRSLSANIFTMIQKEIDEALNMTKTATLQKTQSNSDVMKRLRDTFENNDVEKDHYPRNKVKQRHNTVNLFVNNIHAPTHHFAKDDSYIHKDDKHLAKPSSCDKSKSSSPSNRSPQASKRSSKDEFQHVLSMLAQEAMDTSNKLGVALAELDKNRNNCDKKSDVQSRISDSRLSFLNTLTNKSTEEVPSEIKMVNVHAEVITEPKDNAEYCNDSKGKKTEDSLLAISDQLHRVEDKLKHSIEKDLNFDDESKKLTNYVANTEERMKAQETTVLLPETKLIPDVVPLTVQNDSIKIDSINLNKNQTNTETIPKMPEIKSTNPFINMDDKLKEINEINAFQELKNGISDLIAGITQVNEKLFLSKDPKTEPSNNPGEKVRSMSEASEKLNQVSQNVKNQEVPNRASVNLSIYEDDLELKRDAADSTEYNSSEELATIFKLDKSKKCNNVATENESERAIREELSSPQLVKTVNQHLRRLSVDQTDECAPSQSNPLPNNAAPWRTKRQNISQKDNRGDSTQSKRSWRDSGTLMLACTYALMFTQQMADLDWLTLLGLLLAIITIIAMLII